MSDPRTNPPRSTRPESNYTMYYIIGAIVLAIIAFYMFSNGTNTGMSTPTSDNGGSTIQTPAADVPATGDTATPAAPATGDTATPAPATGGTTTPAAPANP